MRTDLYERIKHALLKKTKRLNKDDYPNFAKDVLFIIDSGSFCFEEGLVRMIEETKSLLSNYKRNYSTIILYCDGDLYYCEMNTGIIKK